MEQALPIHAKRADIVAAVRAHSRLIVTSETGSGKTTLIPCFLYEAGFAEEGMIAVVQPRRIAAVSVANYVAAQYGEAPGGIVGYQIRNEKFVDERRTKIKFMTYGVLTRELAFDPLLTRYKGVMLDEGHERGTEQEFLMAILRHIASVRKDFRLIISSATININRFARYFHAPVLEIPGRRHAVTIEYAPRPHQDVVTAAAEAAISDGRRVEGSILIFVAGYDDIEKVMMLLERSSFIRSRYRAILPLFANQSPKEHLRVLTCKERVIIVSTNIAEMSVTPDADLVIDTCMINQMRYWPKSGHSSLDTIWHSQAGLTQRAGRTGRLRDGLVLRMCSQDQYDAMHPFTMPEVRRSDLSPISMQLLSTGMPLRTIVGLKLMDRPHNDAWRAAKRSLVALDAIEAKTEQLTEDGETMSCLAMDPTMARMVLASIPLGCLHDVADIAASFTAHRWARRPPGSRDEADKAHDQFADDRSDFVAFCRAKRAWENAPDPEAFAETNFLNHPALLDIVKSSAQVIETLAARGIVQQRREFMPDRIGMAVATGLSATNLLRYHKAKNDEDSCYLTADGTKVTIFPGSFVRDSEPSEYLVAAEIVKTRRRFARNVQQVHASWLDRLPRPIALIGSEDGTREDVILHITRREKGRKHRKERYVNKR